MNRPSADDVPPEPPGRASAAPPPAADPYERLLRGRVVVLGTALDDSAADAVVARLVQLEHQDPRREVSLVINSPGGSFDAMAAVHDTMRFVACDVETVCLGRAGGCAAVLLAAGAPGRRYALPGARVYLEQPSAAEPVRGRATDLAVQADELVRIRTRMEDMLACGTGRPRERVRADLERRTVLDAQGALEYGLVDRVLTGHGTAAAGAPGAR
ncbi:ATP-dependent Clp protease proteolytic subunit [Streptomyces sp. NPDC004065]|uniref:ATP-dependent Clp protease proteolytic subunit n=1 Tax=Streptomyces sp. NPDC004065 TaxID=3364689 RepID=UPI00384B1301